MTSPIAFVTSLDEVINMFASLYDIITMFVRFYDIINMLASFDDFNNIVLMTNVIMLPLTLIISSVHALTL